MNEQEKARGLVGHFEQIEMLKDYEGMGFELAKQCALICVDKKLEEVPMYKGGLNPRYTYLQNVKSEIEKL